LVFVAVQGLTGVASGGCLVAGGDCSCGRMVGKSSRKKRGQLWPRRREKRERGFYVMIFIWLEMMQRVT